MTVVAGVSGLGKSTLVQRVLFPAVRLALGLVAPEPGPYEALRLPQAPRPPPALGKERPRPGIPSRADAGGLRSLPARRCTLAAPPW